MTLPDTDQQTLFGDAAFAYTNGQYDEAFSIFSRLADAGHVASAAYLAELYLSGNGVQRDSTKALELLTFAAMRGNGTAAYNLAVLYHNPAFGVQTDSKKSAHYFQLAKDLGVTLPTPG